MDPLALPTELKLLIARVLWNLDKRSLVALSLVSRDWRAPAQTFIFQTYNLRITGDRIIQDFLHFLQSSPHILSYIRSLRCGEPKRPFERLSFDHPVSVADICALTSTIPSLRTLTIFNCLVSADCCCGRPVEWTISVPTLVLSEVVLQECTLKVFLSGFKGSAFSFAEISFTPADRCGSQALAGTLDFEPLVGCKSIYTGGIISHENYPRILSEIRYNILARCPPVLNKFGTVCDLFDPRDFTAINELLHTKGRHIEDLQLAFSTLTMADEKFAALYDGLVNARDTDGLGVLPKFWRTLSLSECRSLRSITFSLAVNGEPNVESTAILQWRYALRLLAAAPRTLTLIRLGMDFELYVIDASIKRCTLTMVDWKKWDEVLKGFGALQRVEWFRLDMMGDDLSYYEPLQPRGSLPQRFTQALTTHLGERMSDATCKLFRYI
ncbi:hypothetical protein BXZ70DRAFT_1012904 [Cristinia sonorae]|uniref:F-box domain-containing protein n=1 Tax=Cristinia sonorae TaxID=1940300 RepID=A0A8K0XKC1_9AGAR|nr:hypothetical protein BXZ70DRAFT_1012904 [Cristinia sonorae]